MLLVRMKTLSALSLFMILSLFISTSCEEDDKEQEPFKKYTSLLSQEGEHIPTETVLQNDLDLTITWTRLDRGKFRGVLSQRVTSLDKTTIMFQAQSVDRIVTGGFIDEGAIRIDVCSRYNLYDTFDTFENVVVEIKTY